MLRLLHISIKKIILNAGTVKIVFNRIPYALKLLINALYAPSFFLIEIQYNIIPKIKNVPI